MSCLGEYLARVRPTYVCMRYALEKLASAERRERAGSLICDCNLISANWLIGALDMDDTAILRADIRAHTWKGLTKAWKKKGPTGTYNAYARAATFRGAGGGLFKGNTRVHPRLCASTLSWFLLFPSPFLSPYSMSFVFTPLCRSARDSPPF